MAKTGGGHVTASDTPVIGTVTGHPELVADIRNPSMVVSSERQLWKWKIVRVGTFLVTFPFNHQLVTLDLGAISGPNCTFKIVFSNTFLDPKPLQTRSQNTSLCPMTVPNPIAFTPARWRLGNGSTPGWADLPAMPTPGWADRPATPR